jgi:hypothetical protein
MQRRTIQRRCRKARRRKRKPRTERPLKPEKKGNRRAVCSWGRGETPRTRSFPRGMQLGSPIQSVNSQGRYRLERRGNLAERLARCRARAINSGARERKGTGGTGKKGRPLRPVIDGNNFGPGDPESSSDLPTSSSPQGWPGLDPESASLASHPPNAT